MIARRLGSACICALSLLCTPLHSQENSLPEAESRRITVVAHDAAKAIRKLDEGRALIILTGSINTPILYKIRKAIAANTRLEAELDMSKTTGMESIDKEVFAGCTNLTRLAFSDSLTAVSAPVFAGCSNLSTFEATQDSTHFSSADGILYSKDGTQLLLCPPARSGSVTIPAAITGIDGKAFSVAESLDRIEVDAENEFFTASDGIVYSRDMQTLVRCPRGRTEPVHIPEGVTAIGEGAFSFCTTLQSITLPETLTKIEKLAFEGCAALSEISLPQSLTSIGKQAFFGCSSLREVTIPRQVTFIGSRSFYRCKLSAIVFENSTGWTNGKKKLTDLKDIAENPERFNHPGKYWPTDIFRKEDD
ncbi:MAG: leucine-rich repeat domain-containing protein [Treponema sp.]|nr:leucine-rich repeat domain-containing protein [Treponema sp.]